MSRTLDIDAWSERSAIMEFCGGMSRFQAETRAAQAQGFERWEFSDAIRERNTEKSRNRSSSDARQSASTMPAMQPAPEKEARPMSQRHIQV